MRAKRALRVAVIVAIVLVAWPSVRRAMRAAPPRPDAETFEQAKRVRIVRDTWGVPHVFGKSDADAAFGLAYANAEDDWPTVHAVMAASSGHLGLLHASKTALANDYYVALVRIREQLDEGYDALSPEYRAVLEAYARGLNLYAYLHPDESDGRLFPLRGRDVAAGFAHKVPLMFDLPDVLKALGSGEPKKVGDRVLSTEAARERRTMPGSNAHAVAATRSDDDTTRLNVNSHQPWEGPVAWYEAHVVSEEGWNMTGGLFPGAPIVLHGHNDHLGWAHTVNTPDLIDVYEVPASAHVEEKQAPLTVDTGFFTITLHKAVLWAPEYGPVFEANGHRYAIRYAGMGHAIRAGEQWFRMNKATSFAEWKTAMRMQAIPMFNTMYADHDNVFYVYNALIPERSGPWNYEAVLPGDAPGAVWTKYLRFDDLPQVENPASGFVQTCNSTPFGTTTGGLLANPLPDAFPHNAGIELDLTNRARRSLELLGAPGAISRERFMAMKWDRTYAKDARVFLEVLNVLDGAAPADPHEREALAILRAWDGVTSEDSLGATLAILVWRRVDPKHAIGGARGDADGVSPSRALHETVQWLLANFGSVRVRWGDVQRLRRGAVDLPVGGGPDVINAVLARDAWDGRLVGYQGDSYVLEVEFEKDKTTSRSIHQYGASVRAGSPHYADQARLYVAHELKPTLRDPAELAKHTERSYHPGDP